MRSVSIVAALFLFVVPTVLFAHDADVARPELLLKEAAEGMPTADRQEIKVLTATIKPGGKTVFHTHRFPVSIYILEGTFTLEMEGRAPVTVKAGEAMVEPPNVRMTGYNNNPTDPMRVVIFYVSDLDTPFLDPVKSAD